MAPQLWFPIGLAPGPPGLYFGEMKPTPGPRLMIADDHVLSATGTVQLLWQTWPDIALAHTIDSAIRQLDARPVDLLLLDVMFRMEPYRSGFTILRHCAEAHPATRILLLTGFDDGITALAARDQGAHGCLGKHHPPEVLTGAVTTLLAGGQYWGELLQRPTLTRQQLAIIGHYARGHSQPEIAERLGIALITVQTHCAEVRRRLHASSTAHAVYLATRLGIIIPDEWPPGPHRVRPIGQDSFRESGGGGGQTKP